MELVKWQKWQASWQNIALLVDFSHVGNIELIFDFLLFPFCIHAFANRWRTLSSRWSRNWTWCLRSIQVRSLSAMSAPLRTFGHRAREFFPPPFHQLDLPLHLLHHLHFQIKVLIMTSGIRFYNFGCWFDDFSWGCKLSKGGSRKRGTRCTCWIKCLQIRNRLMANKCRTSTDPFFNLWSIDQCP